jgi:hypothetical protein
MARSPMRATGDGYFASDRWRAGEYIRDRFTLTVPGDWNASGLAFGLVAMDGAGAKAEATGVAPANDPNLLVLGALPLPPVAPAPTPTVAPPPLPTPVGPGSGKP